MKEAAKGSSQERAVVISLVHNLLDAFEAAGRLLRNLKQIQQGADGDEDGPESWYKKPLRRRRNSDSGSDRGHGRRDGDRKSRDKSRPRDGQAQDLIHVFGEQVMAEYQRGYERFGEKFALGDAATQNRMQAQVISVQNTIIPLYQEYTFTSGPRKPSIFHLEQLLRATRLAKTAAIDALAIQYRHMLSGPEIPKPEIPKVPGAFPGSNLSDSNELIIRPKPPVEITPPSSDSRSADPASRSLFCPYAVDLQRHPDQPLADSYRSGGDCRCPCCRHHIPARHGKAWELVIEDPRHRNGHRVFMVGRRFVLKSHRRGGGFACTLCTRYSEWDTVCKGVEELVDHVWREHGPRELEGEEDIWEVPMV